MRLNRREFIVAGVVGTALGCQRGTTSRSGSRPIELKVEFSGLCGIVHRRALKLSDVLLIDAAATQTLASTPHTPRLVTDAANFQSGLAPTIQDGLAFWDLTGYKVTLATGATSGTTEVTGPIPSEKIPPNPPLCNSSPKAVCPPNQGHSALPVAWLPQMARLPGTAGGRIDAVNLADNPRPAKVAARIRFTGGEFGTRFRQRYAKIVWRIGTGAPPPFEQAIGEPMVSQSIDAQNVTFLLEQYGSSTSNQIVLAPPGGGNGALNVEVRNMPTTHVECKDPAAQKLEHFAAYYELLQNLPAPSNRPIPTCFDCPDCGAAMEEPVYCPGTEYNP